MDIVGPLPRSHSGNRYVLVNGWASGVFQQDVEGDVEEEEGKDWDKLIHSLLLAYREVPQGTPRLNYCTVGMSKDLWTF